MSWVVVGVGAVSVVSGAYNANQNKKAMQSAANTQSESQQAAMEAQERQMQEFRELLAPYVQSGYTSQMMQQDLLGMNGPRAQKLAIADIEQSPIFASLAKQGEDAILANASATGGLRGGNTQGALAQFRPAVLNDLIRQRFADLSGMTQMGQSSAAGVGAAGINTGQNVAANLSNMGQINAGAILSNQAQNAAMTNQMAQLGSGLLNYGGQQGWFGNNSNPGATQAGYTGAAMQNWMANQ